MAGECFFCGGGVCIVVRLVFKSGSAMVTLQYCVSLVVECGLFIEYGRGFVY